MTLKWQQNTQKVLRKIKFQNIQNWSRNQININCEKREKDQEPRLSL